MKTIKLTIAAAAVLGAMIASTAHARNTWFANIAQDYNPGPGQFVKNPLYNNPLNCRFAPDGADEPWSPKSSASVGYVTTLGDGGSIVIGFSEPIQDNPKNPYGLDFIVFSNCYFITAVAPEYDPGYRWQEPAFVEISNDGQTWYLIRPNLLPSELTGGVDTGASETALRGYAEYTPSIHLPSTSVSYDPFSTVTRTAEELYTVPERPSLPDGYNTLRFDYVSGGGDAFDIEDAVVEVQSTPGVPALDANGKEIPAGLTEFGFVRLTDAIVGDQTANFGEISAEIDAVSAVRPSVTIGEAKKLTTGNYALITDAMVTAVLPDEFFIESPDRSAAMKVIYNTSVAVDGKLVEVGDKLTITGHLSASGGQYTLPDPMFSCTSITDSRLQPLGMTVKSLDSDIAYGLLVRTWGKVTARGQGYCVISDGSSSASVVWTDDSYSLPDDYDYIAATGICDRSSDGAVLRVTDPSTNIDTYQSQAN